MRARARTFGRLLAAIVVLFWTGGGPRSVIADDDSPRNNPVGINVARLSQDRFVGAVGGLVNSNGGDWGYITITWTSEDREYPHANWLMDRFLDRCYENHLQPIVRIATWHDDYRGEWVRPDWDEPVRWRTWLERGNWPNRPVYVIVGNEPNLGFEWGGEVDAASYARYLERFMDVFADSDRFRIVNAPLDISNSTRLPEMQDGLEFVEEMRAEVPDIFERLPAWASNPYQVPSSGDDVRFTHRAYEVELEAIGRELPVIITESGLMETDDDYAIADYFDRAFRDWLTDPRVLAITPLFWNPHTERFWMFTPNPDGTVELASPTYKRILAIPKPTGSPTYEPAIANAPGRSANATSIFRPGRSGSAAPVFRPEGESTERADSDLDEPSARRSLMRVANTDGAGVNVRSAPSATAPRIAGLREGTVVETIAEREVDGRRWQQIRAEDGTEGWVAKELLVPVQDGLSPVRGAARPG